MQWVYCNPTTLAASFHKFVEEGQFIEGAVCGELRSTDGECVSVHLLNTASVGEYKMCVMVQCDDCVQHNRPVIACYHPPLPDSLKWCC